MRKVSRIVTDESRQANEIARSRSGSLRHAAEQSRRAERRSPGRQWTYGADSGLTQR